MRKNIGKWIVAVLSAAAVWAVANPVAVQAAQWKLDQTGWWYQLDNGSYAKNGWKYIHGAWYYFNQYGYMATGWVKDGDTWYYLKDSGAMATGWVKDGDTWYYLKDSGAMATGWVKDGDTWYYLKDSGAMATGWVNDNGLWYYMNSDGSMETDFIDVTGQYPQLGLQSEEVTLDIPGLHNEYTFLWVSDLHIIAGTEEIAQEDLTTVKGRMEDFQTSTGVGSAALWKQLPAILDSCHADAVFFGGDMIDHASEENIACLKQGLDELQTPYIYVRADHDLLPSYCENQNLQRVNELHEQIDGNHAVSCLEYDDLCVIGINNSTSQLTSEALTEIKAIYAKGKPIIIITHVPLNSMVDPSLGEKSKQVWQDRNLSWGSGCYYEPDAMTQEFLDLVYAEDSLIKGVLCGHMHFQWDGQLTADTREHIFSASANGTIGIVHVTDVEE